jgi:hypothetical protein
VNERTDAIATARAPASGRPLTRSPTASHTVRALLLVFACGFAHAQDALSDLVAADARRCLHYADADVRGEAALVLAGGADVALQGELLALAKDPQAPARQRALIALGLVGSSAAVQILSDLLAETTVRGDADGVAAAFGLGLVPSERASTAIAQVLSLFAQSSWKRQRDTVLALLLAMASHGPRSETAALRRIYDDDSNRDPEVRGLLLQVLLGNDHSLDDKFVRRVLVRGGEAERVAVLQWFAREPKNDPEWLAAIERIATEGTTTELRAHALEALTAARHLPALDIALRALREAGPAECAQAMHTLLAIGGPGTLRAAVPRIVDERDPARKAAMIANFAAPLTPEFADQCARLAGDASQPWSLRDAAAQALAHVDGSRAAPLLREAFRLTNDAAALPALARAIGATHDEPVALPRLLDGNTDLRTQGPRWIALIQAEHPEARRQVLAALHPDVRGASPLPGLRAWRCATVIVVPPARPEAIPAVLAKLLAP